MSQLRRQKYVGQRGKTDNVYAAVDQSLLRKESLEWCMTVTEERKLLLILSFFSVFKAHFCKGRLLLFCQTSAPCWRKPSPSLMLPIVFYRPQMIFRYFPCCNTPRLRKWNNNTVHTFFLFFLRKRMSNCGNKKPRHVLVHLKTPLKGWGSSSVWNF